eukprot:Filipodium_phascolosomae@DN1584_c0_g1_i2.p1
MMGLDQAVERFRSSVAHDPMQRSLQSVRFILDCRLQGSFSISEKLVAQKSLPFSKVYIPDSLDSIDLLVAEIINYNPLLLEKNDIERFSIGQYRLQGRTVRLTLAHEYKCSQPHVIVIDGPLKQRLKEYLESSDNHIEFEPVATDQKAKLFMIPREQRLSFKATHCRDRIQAMKLATREASERENAARQTSQQFPAYDGEGLKTEASKGLLPFVPGISGIGRMCQNYANSGWQALQQKQMLWMQGGQ